MTPGGFHVLRAPLGAGRGVPLSPGDWQGARRTARIHELATRCKQGLAAIGGKVKLHTPMSDELSAGIICFEI